MGAGEQIGSPGASVRVIRRRRYRPEECGHWAWGALRVETPPKEWVCPHCGKNRNARMRKRENFVGRHVYLYGEPRCSPCAHEWHDRHCYG